MVSSLIVVRKPKSTVGKVSVQDKLLSTFNTGLMFCGSVLFCCYTSGDKLYYVATWYHRFWTTDTFKLRTLVGNSSFWDAIQTYLVTVKSSCRCITWRIINNNSVRIINISSKLEKKSNIDMDYTKSFQWYFIFTQFCFSIPIDFNFLTRN